MKAILDALLRPGPMESSPDVVMEMSGGLQTLAVFHPSKTGGTSLRNSLGLSNQINHGTPVQTVTRAQWVKSVTVVTIRNPLNRWVSSYWFHTSPQYSGKHAASVKRPDGQRISPHEYYALARKHKLIPSQWRYVIYPSLAKPVVDIRLRLEDVSHWQTILADKDIQANTVLRLKKSVREGSDTSVPMSRWLRLRVMTSYLADYVLLGYCFPSFTKPTA